MIIKSGNVLDMDIDHTKVEHSDSLSKKIDEAREEAEEIIIEAEERAREMLNSSKEEANNIISLANQEAESIRAQAKEEGFKEGRPIGYEEGLENGYKDGSEKAYAELEEEKREALLEINNIKDDLIRTRERLKKDLEADIIEMVEVIFEKIVRQVMIDDEALIISMVEKGIESLDTREVLSIITSKKDYDYLMLYEDRIKEKVDFTEGFNIKYDSDMVDGDCIIETNKGNIDISLVKQINELKRFLKETLENKE